MLARLGSLPDYVRRPIRVFAMVFLGVFSLALTGYLQDVVEWASASDRPFPGLTPLGKAAVAASAAGAGAAVAFVVNALEEKTKMPALLKAPASSGENPVPGE